MEETMVKNVKVNSHLKVENVALDQIAFLPTSQGERREEQEQIGFSAEKDVSVRSDIEEPDVNVED